MDMNFDDDFEEDEQLLHSKDFVNKFYEFTTYQQATEWILKWYKEMKHNTTEFTNEFPALIDTGTDYRSEKLAKLKAATDDADNNPEELSKFPKEQLMSQCIVDFGMF